MKLSDFIRVKMTAVLPMVVAVLALSSCGMVYEDEGDCNTYCDVRFVYDRNMEFADAFASKVEAVDLYVFDADGKFLRQVSERGDALKADGYRMPLDLQPGQYTVLAWCGLNGELDSYDVPEPTPGVTTLQEMQCRLADRQTTGGETVVGEIDNLFHGMTTFTLPDEEGRHTYTVELTKNTNNVRVVLQQNPKDDSEPLNSNDFVFTITDENGLLDYDNSVLDDELLSYRPFYTAQGTASINTGEDDDDAITSVSTVLAEFTVSRLFKWEDKNRGARLTITKAKPEDDGTYKTVLSIPLVDVALLVKGYDNRDMDDQEYLDRQDEYNLIFLLDENGIWTSAQIIVNSWTVVYSETGLGSN